MLTEVRRYRTFVHDLWRYLGREFPADECRLMLADELRDRERSFLELLERAVYRRPQSPYRALLAHAGIEHGDVAALVQDGGLEQALGRLHAEGVYLTLDEFKGHRPIVRSGGFELATSERDFDNPVLRAGFTGVTGGSRGAPRRTMVDFEHVVLQTATQRLLLDAFGLGDRTLVLWRPAPPARTGFSNALRALRFRMPVEWYSQNGVGFGDVELQDWVALRTAIVATRLRGPALPRPRHVSLDRADVVARRLGELAHEGTPALFDSTAGGGVRVALTAAEAGIDLGGTFFRLGGEPLTRAKVDAVERVGARAYANYALSELGRAGLACAAPDRLAVDDVHVLSGRVAMLLRPTADPRFDVQALVLTTLLPTASKLMLNVESGDTGVLEERDCGCMIGAAGYPLHLHTIRSYEKLTSEGTNFLGGDLVRLVENVLPARFGGGPTDYQFVEDEQNGLPRVRLLVSPRVGAVDEQAVLEQALAALADGGGWKQMMAGIWRDGATLTVERAEPFSTPAAKIHAFHLLPRP